MKKILLVLLILNTGCSTSYLIDSRPSGAQVFSGDSNTAIGQTPLELTLEQITEKLGEGGLIRLELPGHFPLTVWLPNAKQKLQAVINMNPLKASNRKSDTTTLVNVPRSKINNLTDLLLDYQFKLLSNQERPPSATMVQLAETNANLGSAYYLAALAFIAEQNRTEGLRYAERAARLSPLENDFHILLESNQQPNQGANQ